MENYIKVDFSVAVTDEDIDDIMSSALNWISYWCENVEVVGEFLGEYANEQISNDGELIFHTIEDPVDETPEILEYKLDKDKFLSAIAVWLSELSDEEKGGIIIKGCAYNEFTLDVGQIDGARADEIIQIALFDEVVFG